VVRPKRRRTIAVLVRRELLGPVPRRGRRRPRGFRKRCRHRFGSGHRDVFRGRRRVRFDRRASGFGGRFVCSRSGRVAVSAEGSPMTRPVRSTRSDLRDRGRDVGPRGLWAGIGPTGHGDGGGSRSLRVPRVPRVPRIPRGPRVARGMVPLSTLLRHFADRFRGRPDLLRQPDVGAERRGLGRVEQPRRDPQRDQADDEDRRPPPDPAPPDPHARHLWLRGGGWGSLPPGGGKGWKLGGWRPRLGTGAGRAGARARDAAACGWRPEVRGTRPSRAGARGTRCGRLVHDPGRLWPWPRRPGPWGVEEGSPEPHGKTRLQLPLLCGGRCRRSVSRHANVRRVRAGRGTS
jgi:hypothetical protein